MLGLLSGVNEANPVPLKVQGSVNLRKMRAGSFIKAVSLFGDSSQEVMLDRSRQFSFAGLVEGKYILLVLSKGQVVGSRTIEVPYTGPAIKIDVINR